jgi:hypothetical protein
MAGDKIDLGIWVCYPKIRVANLTDMGKPENRRIGMYLLCL